MHINWIGKSSELKLHCFCLFGAYSMPKDKYSVAPIDWNRSNLSVKAYYNYTFIVQIKNIMSFKHTHIYIFKMLNKQKKNIQQCAHNFYMYERQGKEFLWFGSFRTNVEWWNVILTKVTAFVTALLTTTIRETPQTRQTRRTVGQIPKKCKETSNLMWLSLIWFNYFRFFVETYFVQ